MSKSIAKIGLSPVINSGVIRLHINTKMINQFLPVITSILLFVGSANAQNFDQKSVLADLETLYQSLQQTHYNLFAYTPQQEFEAHYQKLKQSVKQDSLSLLETTSLFQQLISKANTGHAEINFPATPYRAYAMGGGTVFPLEISVQGGKSIITRNFSNNPALQVGGELVAINDLPIQQVLEKIYPQLSAETTYFKNAKLELFSLPRLYWQVFGAKDNFRVNLKVKEETIEVEVPAINLIEDFEMKRTEIITADQSIKWYDNTAYLKPGNFSGDESAFKQYIDSVFIEINTKSVDHLIIDLRNNSGGHQAFSDYLVSYIADQAFKWHSHFSLKSSNLLKIQTRLESDTTSAYAQNILTHKSGEIFDYSFEAFLPQEESKQFHGKVYVLINRHSYSMAAVTAAMIQDYKFGTIVGEETGDFPTLYAAQFQYPLPNTGIAAKVPKGYMIRPNGSEIKRGVVPDLELREDVSTEADEMLEQLLKIIVSQ